MRFRHFLKEARGDSGDVPGIASRSTRRHRQSAQQLPGASDDRWNVEATNAILAWPYAGGGHSDRAIALLERLLSTHYRDALTVYDLRYFLWDPLRDDPRFEEMLETYE